MGYGKIILDLGLYKAKQLGLKQVLIMCEDSNIGSIRIIEQNKGVFIERYKLKVEGKDTYIRKYNIDLE
jgi:predicted acetyltransferase